MNRNGLWRASRIVVLLLVVASGLGAASWVLGTHNRPISVLAGDPVGPDPSGDTLVRRSDNGAVGDPLVYFPIVVRQWPPIPDAPQLEPIVNPDRESSYLVLWSSSFLATYYVLEEATDSAFSDTHEVFVELGLLYSAVGKAPGHYFYRAKAVHTTDTASYSSPWSNVVSTHVVVPYVYQDTFSDATSGWPHSVFDLDGYPILSTFYMGGAYYMRILDDAGLSDERMGIVPAPYEHFDDTYDVEVDQIFIQVGDTPPDWAKASLVFSGEIGPGGYFTSVYAIEWNYEGNCAVSAYTGSYMDSFIPADAVPNPIYQGWVHCPSITPGANHNVHALAEVRGDRVTIYLNGGLIGTFSPIGGQPYMGLITGAWQAVPVESCFDNFRVTDR
jgi:hypothetical protein